MTRYQRKCQPNYPPPNRYLPKLAFVPVQFVGEPDHFGESSFSPRSVYSKLDLQVLRPESRGGQGSSCFVWILELASIVPWQFYNKINSYTKELL